MARFASSQQKVEVIDKVAVPSLAMVNLLAPAVTPRRSRFASAAAPFVDYTSGLLVAA